jgi:hypothetical protein
MASSERIESVVIKKLFTNTRSLASPFHFLCGKFAGCCVYRFNTAVNVSIADV